MMLKTTASIASIMCLSAVANAAQLNIESATDWGGTVDGYPASNAIDGSTAWASRWKASNGDSENLELDLGSVQSITDVAVAWGKGDDRTHRFEIRTLADESSNSWTKVYSGTSSGLSETYENYDVTDIDARWVRIKIFENSDGDEYTNIKEVRIYGGESTDPGNGDNDYGLDASQPPSYNFDLWDWYLSVPTDTDGSGTADSIKEDALNNGYESQYFYTADDGGMVFECTVGGYKTSSNTSYTRTELREMLRRGDTSVGTSSAENNWAFSSIPSSSQSDFGGIDGEMKATLAVNKVTTTASSTEQNGRIVIGQIHAENNEPIRLYYHKLPGNSNGAVYFAHETSSSDGGNETWYNLLGSMVDSSGEISSTSNPSAGMALDEHFSYQITVEGDDLTVIISQNGSQLAKKTVDMSGSGYDDADNYMYFKAGLYLQDKTGDDDDYAKVTFYELTNTHDNYGY
ncbi:polysaccharide lyase family 7 protein [Vibrio hippocampi]|uniref:F5/8 type C domain-containing protein n=1 Tax=Vibrio hippocampi TaxID=654686 RepID=A0ABM8ZHU2_9VIBR|nr:polysaccharide lyase family 7 protein [Vibrio hippocampi]CAH0525394.1 hypothetical protein VHP8226_00953 [Vibrio hippocampi]